METVILYFRYEDASFHVEKRLHSVEFNIVRVNFLDDDISIIKEFKDH